MAALPPPEESPVVAALDAAYVAAHHEDKRRTYLGGSVIGKECARAIWYEFRWCGAPEEFEGRMLRLFETGHREEGRMVRDLTNAGMTVRALDPETGEQYEITFAKGHGGGHTDGEVEGVPGAPVVLHLLECKTHNAKSFAQLQKLKVKVAKPQHYAQMQTYMRGRGLTRALYLAKNKDTDEYYAERVPYDEAYAALLMMKADGIVAAHVPPPKISDDPESFACRFCSKKPECHHGAWADRSCRTCLHSTPIDGGVWWCERHNVGLSRADQEAGCAEHLYLPGLVPGKQTDAADDMSSVTYAMADGSKWIDGNKPAGPLVVGGVA